MLVSPDFLFRIERDPRGAPPARSTASTDFELASRLSFFLWSSIPDDELLGLAEKGKLKDPAVLAAAGAPHAGRSSARRRWSTTSPASGSTCATWPLAKPDPEAFPEFDESLRQAFLAGNEAVLPEHPARRPQPARPADANYTYLNQRLAEHYGIPNIYGSQFRRVTLTDPNRGGLLGQGSILTVTSYPNRTSVVQRGKWILETLLGAPPPPPPPGIPDFQPQRQGRQTALPCASQMEQHRANAVCASCHSRMDPLGFALENFDGVGKWRTEDAGSAIDPSGKLPDGTRSPVPRGSRKCCSPRKRDEFLTTATAEAADLRAGPRPGVL